MIVVSLLASGCALFRPAAKVTSRVEYHGWKKCHVLRSHRAEVVVVPAIGRVMSFRLSNGENVFWENEALFGSAHQEGDAAWRAGDWVNFGGDKSWPAPEGAWSALTRRNWRPPPAFDGIPMQAKVEGRDVILTSAIDPYYGVRVKRRVHLDGVGPILRITTTYEKVRGEPVNVSVWVITQFKEPAGVFAPLPMRWERTNGVPLRAVSVPTRFPAGYTLLSREPPPDLKVERNLISLTRNPKSAHKIGIDGKSLVWVGEKEWCIVSSPPVPDADYPDGGSSLEIYTNPDPLKYIELETLGPLRQMKVGDTISQVTTYHLFPRRKPVAADEPRSFFGIR